MIKSFIRPMPLLAQVKGTPPFPFLWVDAFGTGWLRYLQRGTFDNKRDMCVVEGNEGSKFSVGDVTSLVTSDQDAWERRLRHGQTVELSNMEK